MSWWPSPVQQDLLLAATQPPPVAAAALARWQAAVNPREIESGSYRLLPLLCHNISDLPDAAPLLPMLRSIRHREWVKARVVLHEGVRALRALEAAGIRAMLLKGAALVAQGTAPELRPMSDVDVLVRGPDWKRATAALEGIGLSGAGRGMHARNFSREGSHAAVELHVAPLKRALDAGVPVDLWAHAVPAALQGTPALVPSPADQLVHAIAHGIEWNEVAPIRWVPDALMILERGGVDWERVAYVTRGWSSTPAVLVGLEYLASTFSAPVPEGVLRELRQRGATLRERILFHAATRRRGLHSAPLLPWRYWTYVRRAAAADRLRQEPAGFVGRIGSTAVSTPLHLARKISYDLGFRRQKPGA